MIITIIMYASNFYYLKKFLKSRNLYSAFNVASSTVPHKSIKCLVYFNVTFNWKIPSNQGIVNFYFTYRTSYFPVFLQESYPSSQWTCEPHQDNELGVPGTSPEALQGSSFPWDCTAGGMYNSEWLATISAMNEDCLLIE